MTAGMATYIAKNKLRPRPRMAEDTSTPKAKPSNPFQDPAHAIRRRRALAASHDQQAVSAGDDAGAAARLQSDLHRLRTHSRIRSHHQRTAVARAVPGGGRRVRRADGLHLRRRADDVSRDRRAGGGNPRARQEYLSSAPTACSS